MSLPLDLERSSSRAGRFSTAFGGYAGDFVWIRSREAPVVRRRPQARLVDEGRSVLPTGRRAGRGLPERPRRRSPVTNETRYRARPCGGPVAGARQRRKQTPAPCPRERFLEGSSRGRRHPRDGERRPPIRRESPQRNRPGSVSLAMHTTSLAEAALLDRIMWAHPLTSGHGPLSSDS